jgi:hypothetical protein
LYEVLVAGAAAFIWAPIVFLAVFAVAWVYFYRVGSVSAGHPAAA